MIPLAFTADGKPLKLGNRIGKGGEGEVYSLDGTTAVKFYTVADTRSREEKIRKMISEGFAKKSPLIAFPISEVRDKTGRFLGFTMMKVSGHQPLFELYSPGARKAAFPQADYRFLVRTATNIARAVASAHLVSCVIGDLNESGILISDSATAALIDADSFQLVNGSARYLCKVGKPDYTPPELQGKNLDSVVRNPNHDAFGLAVLIFQLLWMGRHPFSGKPLKGDVPIEKAIGEFRFAYSRIRSVGLDPPPAVPSLVEFPLPVAAAFEKAFGPEGIQERPSAKEWTGMLSDLEKSLRSCSANPLHFYPAQATECVWCRMERKMGVLLFIPSVAAFTSGTGFAPTQGDLATIWKAIEAIPAPPSSARVASVRTPNLSPSIGAQTAKRKKWMPKAVGTGLLCIAGLILFAAPEAFVVAVIVAIVGLAQLSKKTNAEQEFVRKYKDVETRWIQAEREWQNRNAAAQFEKLRDSLTALKAEHDALPVEEKRKIAAYEQSRRAEQLKMFLGGFQIRRFKIPHVGPSKLATLTSYGIESAADVTERSVLAVPGFGPVNSKPLLEWRRKLEARFVYNPNPTTADQVAISTIKAQTSRRSNEIKAQLSTGPERLLKFSAAIRQAQQAVDPVLQRLHEQKSQAKTDLDFLGIAIPPSTMPSPQTVPQAARTATPIGAAINPPTRPHWGNLAQCPQCGGAMVLRTARKGFRSGSKFYGCSRYPVCRGTRPFP